MTEDQEAGGGNVGRIASLDISRKWKLSNENTNLFIRPLFVVGDVMLGGQVEYINKINNYIYIYL